MWKYAKYDQLKNKISIKSISEELRRSLSDLDKKRNVISKKIKGKKVPEHPHPALISMVSKNKKQMWKYAKYDQLKNKISIKSISEYYVEMKIIQPAIWIGLISVWFIGLYSLSLIKKNTLLILMSLELMLLSIDLILIGISNYVDNLSGSVLVLLILTVAAGEAAVGLSILVSFERVKGTVLLDSLKELKN